VSLTITVLGASGTYPAPGTACSGYLLRSDSTTVWLDCGSGSLSNLQRHLPLTDLDGIVCTHCHPDHWMELPLALNALRYGLGARDAAIPLYWTAGTAKLFSSVSHPPEPTFAPEVVDESSQIRVGDIDFRFSRTDHPVETLAVRAESRGRVIAYSSDTGDDWELSSLGSGIDLALVEATLDEADSGTVQHLTASQAGHQAARAGVASLVITHLAPGSDTDARVREASEAFGGPVTAARTDERY
jgi:ribonuclease BN (tRNA processing enzyme)